MERLFHIGHGLVNSSEGTHQLCWLPRSTSTTPMQHPCWTGRKLKIASPKRNRHDYVFLRVQHAELLTLGMHAVEMLTNLPARVTVRVVCFDGKGTSDKPIADLCWMASADHSCRTARDLKIASGNKAEAEWLLRIQQFPRCDRCDRLYAYSDLVTRRPRCFTIF